MRKGHAVTLALVLGGTVSFAQTDVNRPWAALVTPDRQARAMALFRDGNEALKESLYSKAATTYLLALKQWDHPAIHYNLAVALTNLDQPEEVRTHLKESLRFGAEPLGNDTFQQAKERLVAVERSLTQLKVTCLVEGASVRLDGRHLFTGPGQWDGLVRPGPHALIASKEGLMPDERAFTLLAGDTRTFQLNVHQVEAFTEYHEAFSPAVAWVILGTGVAALGTGVGLHVTAGGRFGAYDQGIAQCAAANGPTQGCVPSPALQETRNSAAGLQAGAYSLYAVGGAALATSVFLFYVGRPVAYRRSTAVALVPMLGPQTAGAVISGEF